MDGALSPDSPLRYGNGDPWDSLAVVSTLAVIDEVCAKPVNGQALSKCCTAADVINLAGVGEND